MHYWIPKRPTVFISELSDNQSIMNFSFSWIIIGDFNLHIDKENSEPKIDLKKIYIWFFCFTLSSYFFLVALPSCQGCGSQIAIHLVPLPKAASIEVRISLLMLTLVNPFYCFPNHLTDGRWKPFFDWSPFDRSERRKRVGVSLTRDESNPRP